MKQGLEMLVKKVAVCGAAAAMASWAIFAWSLTGAFIAHVFTNG